MIGRNKISGRYTVTGTMIFVVVALFSISLAGTAAAAGNAASIKGEIVAVDTYDGTITVRPLGAAGLVSPLTFAIDRGTSVTSCAMNRAVEDLMAGERVTIRYHETDGRLHAEAVDIPPVILACYDE